MIILVLLFMNFIPIIYKHRREAGPPKVIKINHFNFISFDFSCGFLCGIEKVQLL